MDILDQMEAWRKNARFISEQDFFSRMMFEIIKNRKEIERLREGFVWLDDTIEGHLLFNPENKDSKLIQEIKRKISFILSNGEE